MPTTLTLKNIPDEVYERLKHSAALHRRSLSSEAIVCLRKFCWRSGEHLTSGLPVRARCAACFKRAP